MISGNPEESCFARASVPRKTKYRREREGWVYVFCRKCLSEIGFTASLHMLLVLRIDSFVRKRMQIPGRTKYVVAKQQADICSSLALVAIVTRYNLA